MSQEIRGLNEVYESERFRHLGVDRRTFLRAALASSVASGGLATISEPAAAQSSENDWPQFQYDSSNLGYNPNVAGPKSNPDIRWRFGTNGDISGAPIVADNIVYVGSEDGNLYAIDGSTGEEVWRFTVGARIRGI